MNTDKTQIQNSVWSICEDLCQSVANRIPAGIRLETVAVSPVALAPRQGSKNNIGQRPMPLPLRRQFQLRARDAA
jgi:hypothetical protein